MSISSTFERLHKRAKGNRWLWLFAIFNRIVLAYAFIVAGMVKILGERFASGLSVNHPMGHYLEALHQTGYYYTYIGIAQIIAAIFLLIPRTVTLGAFIYFPIILNIWILSFATRFDGSLFTAPLMTLANLFLLGWNYEKWKYILPFNRLETEQKINDSDVQSAERIGFFERYSIRSLYNRLRGFLKQLLSDKFPFLFFGGVFATAVFFILVVPGLFGVLPRNSSKDCLKQFKNGDSTQEAGVVFCECIHKKGEPLNKCLNIYENASADKK